MLAVLYIIRLGHVAITIVIFLLGSVLCIAYNIWMACLVWQHNYLLVGVIFEMVVLLELWLSDRMMCGRVDIGR